MSAPFVNAKKENNSEAGNRGGIAENRGGKASGEAGRKNDQVSGEGKGIYGIACKAAGRGGQCRQAAGEGIGGKGV